MRQEIEIEFKNLLTLTEWEKICSHFHINQESFVKQTNYYFDTEDFQLKRHMSSLRIRERNNAYEMTLKQKLNTKVLESHIDLTPEDGELLTSSAEGISFHGGKLLKNMDVDADQLQLYGSLVTERTSFPYKGGVLFLDKNIYFNQTDYELEYEVRNEKNGKKEFIALLQGLDIPLKPAKSKIRRFFEAKNNS